MRKTFLTKYYQKKALKYGISSSRLIQTLALIDSQKPLRILDVGCASGYVGKILKSQGHYVVGFDISSEAINKANKVLNEAYVVDIESSPLPVLSKFDLILLSEVVEHLFQPSRTLKRLTRYLKRGARVIISTPNFLYWGHRLEYLKGNFEYTSQGVFDESHIHFFTYSRVQKLLSENSLKVEREQHLAAGFLSKLLVTRYPSLFAYHLILRSKYLK